MRPNAVAVLLLSWAVLSASQCTRSTRPGYDCMQDNYFQFHWNLSQNKSTLDLAVVVSGGGWVGLGFSESGHMATSDAVIGVNGVVSAHSLIGKSPSGVIKMPFAEWLLNGSLTQEGSKSVLALRRTVHGGTVAVELARPMWFIAAMHTDSQTLTHHSARQSFSVMLDETPPAPGSTPAPDTAIPQDTLVPFNPPLTTPTPTQNFFNRKCPPSFLSMNDSVGMVWDDNAAGVYRCSRTLETGAVVIHWTAEEDGVHYALSTEKAGWSAISFPFQTGKMGPAHAIVRTGVLAGRFIVREDKKPNSVYLSTLDILPAITEVSAEVVIGAAGTHYITRFYVDRHAKDKLPGQYDGEQDVLNFNYAYHETEKEIREGHSGRGSVSLDLKSGHGLFDNEDAPKDSRHKAAVHAIVLTFTWAFVVPAGIIFQKFGRTVFQLDLEVWGMPLNNCVHKVVMLSAAVITYIGAGIALAQFNRGAQYGHKEVGITVMSLLSVQILLPFLRTEDMYDVNHPLRYTFRLVHMCLGGGVVLLSYVNILTGAANYSHMYPTNSQLTTKVLVAFFFVVSGGVAAFVALKIRRCHVAARPRRDSIETIGDGVGAKACDNTRYGD